GVVGRELSLEVELDGELAHAGGEQRGEDHRYDQHQPGSSHDEIRVASQEWEHVESSVFGTVSGFVEAEAAQDHLRDVRAGSRLDLLCAHAAADELSLGAVG